MNLQHPLDQNYVEFKLEKFVEKLIDYKLDIKNHSYHTIGLHVFAKQLPYLRTFFLQVFLLSMYDSIT